MDRYSKIYFMLINGCVCLVLYTIFSELVASLHPYYVAPSRACAYTS